MHTTFFKASMVISLKQQQGRLTYKSARGQQMARNTHQKMCVKCVVTVVHPSLYLSPLPYHVLVMYLVMCSVPVCVVIFLPYSITSISAVLAEDFILSRFPICPIISPHRWHLDQCLLFFVFVCVWQGLSAWTLHERMQCMQLAVCDCVFWNSL